MNNNNEINRITTKKKRETERERERKKFEYYKILFIYFN